MAQHRGTAPPLRAASGLEAIEIVKTQKIELVVSDVRMPNGNGMDLLKDIRKLHPDIPVVLLATGFADITKADAGELGAYDLLEKPINRSLMIRLLEESCARL